MEEQVINGEQPATNTEVPNTTDTAQPELSAADLQQRLAQIEQESASFKDQYLRGAAEMRNYKRRVE